MRCSRKGREEVLQLPVGCSWFFCSNKKRSLGCLGMFFSFGFLPRADVWVGSSLGEARVGGNFGQRASGICPTQISKFWRVFHRIPILDSGFWEQIKGGGVVRKVQPKLTTTPRSSLPSPSSKTLPFWVNLWLPKYGGEAVDEMPVQAALFTFLFTFSENIEANVGKKKINNKIKNSGNPVVFRRGHTWVGMIFLLQK